jgi:hypothetical protein
MFYLQVKESIWAGYKGNFNNLNKDYAIFSSDNGNNPTIFITLEYKGKLMPLYSIWFQSK